LAALNREAKLGSLVLGSQLATLERAFVLEAVNDYGRGQGVQLGADEVDINPPVVESP
jgi:hypothetical protein